MKICKTIEEVLEQLKKRTNKIIILDEGKEQIGMSSYSQLSEKRLKK